MKEIAQYQAVGGGAVLTVEGVKKVGPLLLEKLIERVNYALGLGIGMADLPFEAIEWYEVATAAAIIAK